MINLATAVLSLGMGYNMPFYMPWTSQANFNKPDQFRNVLITVTEENGSGQFFKYAFISGNDSHNGKYAGSGIWKPDSSETRNKNLAMIGQAFYYDKIRFSVAGGYLDHPDQIRLSGHFQLNLGLGYRFDNWQIGIEHYSNGRGIWGGSMPNIGIDFLQVSYAIGAK